MRKRKNKLNYTDRPEHHFNDDFEVTYTDDLPEINVNFDEEDDFQEDYYEWEDSDSRRRSHRRSQNAPPKDRTPRGESLASPLRAPIRTGTKFVEKIVHILLRFGSPLMVAAITALTALVFWNGHSVYGEPQNIAAEQNITLTVYLIVAGILVLWGLCSFLFVLSNTYSGRGLTFFITYYILSYGALLLGTLLPEEIDLLEGLKNGLLTYGSLHPRIFTLSLLGVIACICRRIFR